MAPGVGNRTWEVGNVEQKALESVFFFFKPCILIGTVVEDCAWIALRPLRNLRDVASLLATFPILATRRSSGRPNSGAGHRFAELVPATQRPAAMGDKDGPEEGVGTLSSVRWPRFSAQLLWPLSSGSQPRQEHWLTRE